MSKTTIVIILATLIVGVGGYAAVIAYQQQREANAIQAQQLAIMQKEQAEKEAQQTKVKKTLEDFKKSLSN